MEGRPLNFDCRFPDFIIAGAPRSGTTFLCHLLDRHPDISMAKPFIPEPKVFFTLAESREAYLARYKAFFSGAAPDQLLGDKTSNYFENEEALERVSQNLPDAKIVVILREPVKRAYSNWQWSTKNGLETLPFADALRLEGKRPSPLPPEKAHARPFDYMTRSRYGTLAKRWIAAFGPNQVRFFLYEHLVRDAEVVSAALQDYLGVTRIDGLPKGLGIINPAGDAGGAIDAVLERELRSAIRTEVDSFALVTGTDIRPWGYQ
jgi:hypothetical protein